ncbi:MAG: hypothetical protein GY715_08235 [Planctomycetes bacterium]|nr:hypothetical protein [Planctomycetota bacterium]
MYRKHHRWLGGGLAITVLISISVALITLRTTAKPAAGDILAELAARDAALCSGGFTSTFEMRLPAVLFDAGQGDEVDQGIVTCSATEVGVSLDATYEQDPIHRAVDTFNYHEMDVDEALNLIVWRTAAKQTLSAPDLNDTIADKEVLIVDSGNVVISTDPHRMLYRYAVGEDDNIFVYEQFLLASGRGYAQHLATLVSETPLGGGLTEVVATGTYGVGYPGTWTLIVDTLADLLVRSASFVDDETAEVALTTTCTGSLTDGGQTIGASGTYNYDVNAGHIYTVEFTNLTFVATTDAILLLDLRTAITAPPLKGSETVDYSVEPPVRIFH